MHSIMYRSNSSEYIICLPFVLTSSLCFYSPRSETDKSCLILHTSGDMKEFPKNQIQGFSNSSWDLPLMKVEHGKQLFADIIKRSPDKDELISDLITMLKDEKKFPDDPEFLRRGVNVQLSSINVSTPTYGTRTRTIILIDENNEMDFYEETLLEDKSWKKTHLIKHLLD